MKNRIEVLVGKSKLNKIPEKLLIYLIVDFITKLPLVAEKDVVLVVCDKLSKITHFVIIIEKILVERLVRFFKDNIWKLYRLLESIVLDRRLQFTAKLTKELNQMLGIEIVVNYLLSLNK